MTRRTNSAFRLSLQTCVPTRIPGHPWDEKGLQKQKRRRSTSVHPETKSAFRPFDKPLINRWLTGRQPQVFSRRLIQEFLCWCLQKNITEHALHAKGLQKTTGRRSTGRQPETKSASRPADQPIINCRYTNCQPVILFVCQLT